MTSIVSLVGTAMAAVLLLDFGCYVWLRHNEAIRSVRAK